MKRILSLAAMAMMVLGMSAQMNVWKDGMYKQYALSEVDSITFGEVVRGDATLEHPSLNGTNYYVFALGEIETKLIENKTIAGFGENQKDKFLYVWENTYLAGVPSGKNFYGQNEGWVALTVGTAGWSGLGYNCSNLTDLNKMAAIMNEPENYYFHIAMKSTDDASHLLILGGGNGNEVKVCIGSVPYVDGTTVYQPIADFVRDGKWCEIEIPMTKLIEKGLKYNGSNTTATNVLCFLSGGTAGVELQYDACFIYKKTK